MSASPAHHSTPITIYYEDTDASGVVYHANYLKYMERARTDFLTELGFDQRALFTQGIAFVVAKLTIDYRKPARLGDKLTVHTDIDSIRRASVNFVQKIWCDAVLIGQANVRIACVSSDDFKPCKLPMPLFEAFARQV